MKKISYEKAVELINSGFFPECKISPRKTVRVKSIQDLDNLRNLKNQKIQAFELFENDSNPELPPNTVQLTFDSALKLLSNNFDLIFYLNSEGNEDEVISIADLKNLYQSFHIRGENLVLYKKE